MPYYYVFRITQTLPMIKQFARQGNHESYKDARKQARH